MPTRSLAVLIVDSHADSAASMGTLVKLSGHAPRVANSLTDALQLASAHPPDVVLLDVRLPDGDGCRVVQEVRRSGTPLVIAITASNSAEDRQRMEQAGIGLHLLKPADPTFLLDLLRRMAQIDKS